MAAGVRLKRQLTLIQGVAVICGLVIGGGIFIAPKAAIRGARSVGLCLVLWAIGGVLATLGALSFAELGTMLPSGGEKYHYLEQVFGPFVGFLYLWVYLLAFRAGGNALKCLTFAKYVLEPAFDCSPPYGAVILVGVLLAWALTTLNCWSVHWSAAGQSFFTSVGICSLIIVAVRGIVYIAMGNTENLENGFSGSSGDAGDVLVALYSAIYSYWGWSALNFLIEELKDPYRNLPRAIWISMSIVTLLYVTANVSYLAVLGTDGVLESDAVAVTFAQKTLGVMSWIMPLCIAINTAGSFNAGSLVGSRLCFVGARKGHFPDVLGLIHVNFLTPITALIFQLVLVVLLICAFDLYTLLNNLVFVNNLFDGLNIVGMLWLRYKRPDLPRPIKVPIVIPVMFLVCMIILIVIPVLTQPKENIIGGVIVLAAGIPYYGLFVLWNKPPAYKVWVAKQTIRVQKLLYCVKEDPDF